MAEINYKTDKPENFSSSERKIFLDLLKQQNKVRNPTAENVNRCKFLCICKVDNKIVSIGAVKPKSPSDFKKNKADLLEMSIAFENEIGYCFTLPEHTGYGYSSEIVKQLTQQTTKQNLMASTELRSDNSMTRILERNGFKQYGKPWKSGIHNGTLGLFLKYAE